MEAIPPRCVHLWSGRATWRATTDVSDDILMMDRFAADLDGNASITKKERDAFKKETGENLLQ